MTADELISSGLKSGQTAQVKITGGMLFDPAGEGPVKLTPNVVRGALPHASSLVS